MATVTKARVSKKVDYKDFVHTGPGTLAGRYLRLFWQPVYCSHELAPGQAVPLRIMSEDFTLYRGEDGTPHLVGFRCAHRGTQLSVGWVEGDCIRCFYHGWKYDGSGQCVEQPAEPEPFVQKIRIPSYPLREYIGLIFAYLGEGDPPPFTRYPNFEDPNSTVDVYVHIRPFNYFQNIDNAMDSTHVPWVHSRHRAHVGDPPIPVNPNLSPEECDWGIVSCSRYASGRETQTFFGMPNIIYVNAQLVDPEFTRHETLIFMVPKDDQEHYQFTAYRVPVTEDVAQRIVERRREKRAKELPETLDLARAVLEGRLRLDDIDPNRIDFVIFEDIVSQGGQANSFRGTIYNGTIYKGVKERLGRADNAVIAVRRVWQRELRALAEGRPLKQWRYHPEMVPTN